MLNELLKPELNKHNDIPLYERWNRISQNEFELF